MHGPYQVVLWRLGAAPVNLSQLSSDPVDSMQDPTVHFCLGYMVLKISQPLWQCWGTFAKF